MLIVASPLPDGRQATNSRWQAPGFDVQLNSHADANAFQFSERTVVGKDAAKAQAGLIFSSKDRGRQGVLNSIPEAQNPLGLREDLMRRFAKLW
jgi:hypothetical protein